MVTTLIGTAVDQLFMMHRIWDMPGMFVYFASYVKNMIHKILIKVRFICRSYISFDILRRVLNDYFGYNVLYVMNITDIDDKIIKRARQHYLYDSYVASSTNVEQIVSDYKEVLDQLNAVIEKNTDPDKKILLARTLNQ